MQLGKFLLYTALVLMVVSCTKWELPEKCTESLPTDISISREGNIITATAGTSSATWSLVNASGTTVNTASGTSYSFTSTTYPNGGYTIKASGKTACNTSFNLTKPYAISAFVEMVNIPGGTFQMGDTRNEGNSNEKPVRSVTVSGFKMGKYEITQKQYQTVMGVNPSLFTNCDDCPVDGVNWENAVAFCNALSDREGKQRVYTINGTTVGINLSANGYRLPTEAEWEYAAGGGSSNRTRFGNGKDILDSKEANFNGFTTSAYSVGGENRLRTIKVGSFIPNVLGLYDMSGNVEEWCSDWYGAYISSSQTNPTGPATGSIRVIRGGSWPNAPEQIRVTYRFSYILSNRISFVGFRVVSL